MPVGTHGNITAKEIGAGVWEARCRYRDLNGVVSRPAARAATKPAAIRALQKKLTELTTAAAKDQVLTRDDRFSKTCDMWLEDQEHRVRHGTLTPGSLRTYLSFLNEHIRPRAGALRNREVKVAVVNTLVKDKRDELGYDSAKTIRTVLSGVCGVAVRHEAMDTNPVRSIEALRRGAGDEKTVTAMTLEQIQPMWVGLAAHAETKTRDSKRRRVGKRAVVWADLAEVSEAMLATGVRIGEVLAVSGDEIGKDDEGYTTVLIDWHIVRVIGEGLRRVPGRKGNKPGVVLRVPAWSSAMWRRRKLAAGTGPVFSALDGGWLDPSNTINRLRDALDECGFKWVTSHVWRKTVAELLDQAGMSNNEIADQLGNTPAVTEKHYRPKRRVNTKGADALQVIRPA